MKQAKLETMPKELRDATQGVAASGAVAHVLDKSAKRMREFKDWPAEDIRSIKAPTLVMVGDADNVRPEHAVEMFRLLPHAQLAVLPGGHGACDRRGDGGAVRGLAGPVRRRQTPKKESKLPELVAAMIEEFLDAPMPEPKARKATTAPQKPEDWPRMFTQHLNAGDLDAVMELYEPDARFVTRSGETIVGRDKIRDVLAGMIKAKTRLAEPGHQGGHRRRHRRCCTPTSRARRSMRRERRSKSVTRRSRSFAASPTAPGSSSWATRTAANEENAAMCSKG